MARVFSLFQAAASCSRNCLGQSKSGLGCNVKRSIMYENAAFCLPEEYSSVVRYSVPLRFDKLCFLQELYLQA